MIQVTDWSNIVPGHSLMRRKGRKLPNIVISEIVIQKCYKSQGKNREKCIKK